jgi:hypothetical protein
MKVHSCDCILKGGVVLFAALLTFIIPSLRLADSINPFHNPEGVYPVLYASFQALGLVETLAVFASSQSQFINTILYVMVYTNNYNKCARISAANNGPALGFNKRTQKLYAKRKIIAWAGRSGSGECLFMDGAKHRRLAFTPLGLLSLSEATPGGGRTHVRVHVGGPPQQCTRKIVNLRLYSNVRRSCAS